MFYHLFANGVAEPFRNLRRGCPFFPRQRQQCRQLGIRNFRGFDFCIVCVNMVATRMLIVVIEDLFAFDTFLVLDYKVLGVVFFVYGCQNCFWRENAGLSDHCIQQGILDPAFESRFGIVECFRIHLLGFHGYRLRALNRFGALLRKFTVLLVASSTKRRVGTGATPRARCSATGRCLAPLQKQTWHITGRSATKLALSD
mmetsp:Transcript_12220/g.28664  ORF Transcript_12220/g.28664 Transcript_12220/m.28664 type:complete len:200 (+) Transcript_12220:1793-2392(+)